MTAVFPPRVCSIFYPGVLALSWMFIMGSQAEASGAPSAFSEGAQLLKDQRPTDHGLPDHRPGQIPPQTLTVQIRSLQVSASPKAAEPVELASMALPAAVPQVGRQHPHWTVNPPASQRDRTTVSVASGAFSPSASAAGQQPSTGEALPQATSTAAEEQSWGNKDQGLTMAALASQRRLPLRPPATSGLGSRPQLPPFSTAAADLAAVPLVRGELSAEVALGASTPELLAPAQPVVEQALDEPSSRSRAAAWAPALQVSFAPPTIPLTSKIFSEQTVAAVPLAQAQPTESPDPSAEATPEEIDPELGIIRIRTAVEDPELGIIRIREQPVIPSGTGPGPAPFVFLTGRITAINSGNIFLSLDPAVGLIGDQFIRPGVTLAAYPALGQDTFLVAAADVNLQRYLNVTSADYDEVRLRLGLWQRLTPRSSAQLSWNYQQLFRPGFQNRFFENNSVDLFLSRRDPITPEVAINTFYQLQLNFSSPQSFDRIVQLAGVYASYQITPQLQAGINYQITLADYTAVDRFDTYQQVIGQLVYQLSPATRLSLFGGFSFGRSSLPSVRFEDTIVGISFEGTVSLF